VPFDQAVFCNCVWMMLALLPPLKFDLSLYLYNWRDALKAGVQVTPSSMTSILGVITGTATSQAYRYDYEQAFIFKAGELCSPASLLTKTELLLWPSYSLYCIYRTVTWPDISSSNRRIVCQYIADREPRKEKDNVRMSHSTNSVPPS
jgi:hypothetical protein